MGLFGKSKHEGHNHETECDGAGKDTNFWPITSYDSGYGQLTDKDTEWSCVTGQGFQTETQVWYTILADGSMVMVQVIWSFLGVPLVPATAQMTFKIYNPNTKEQTWSSTNVSGFKPNGRGCKSSAFDIKHSGTADGEETYAITASLDNEVQINAKFTKPATALGYKYGTGADAGISTFDHRDRKHTTVYMYHRFHPLTNVSGSLFVKGREVDMKGQGMFVHAQQAGNRPNVLASRWNFAFFTTIAGEEDSELGRVSAIQMEFQTTDAYGPEPAVKDGGRAKVNIGCVYSNSLPNSVLLAVGQTETPIAGVYPAPPAQDVCAAEHLNAAKDELTGYMAPHGLTFKWAGARTDGQGSAKAAVTVDDAMSGLVEKVDVLAELPVFLKKALTAMTGAKPYIFQYHNPATLQVESGEKTIPVKGWLYSEATFVSP